MNFIETLYGDNPTGTFTLWTMQDSYSFPISEREAIYSKARELSKTLDVYFDTQHMPGLWIEATYIIDDIQPSVTVSTGEGYQMYYLFTHPQKFKISNHPRFPGTINHKYRAPVEIISHCDIRYDPSEILPYLMDYVDEPVQSTFPTVKIEKIKEKCAWFKMCSDNPAKLSEKELDAMQATMGSDLQQAGPVRCDRIQQEFNCNYCNNCLYKTVIKSPTALGIGNVEPKFPDTDIGNAKKLVHVHGKDLRYAVHLKNWLIWNGKYWEQDNKREIIQRAKETVGGAASYNRIKSIVKLAESEPGIPVTVSDLDRDEMLLNCPNGTIDLTTGELQEHSRDDLITMMTNAEFYPACQHQSTYLQRVFGYAITGSTKENCMFYVPGGESLLAEFHEIMGTYALHGTRHISKGIRFVSGKKVPISIEHPTHKLFWTEPPRISGANIQVVPVEDVGNDLLSWAVQGCLAWQREGLNPPAQSIKYQNPQDYVSKYLSERVVEEKGSRILKALLYDDYEEWCDKNNVPALTKVTFGKTLIEKGYKTIKSGNYYWLDIARVFPGNHT